MIFHKVLWTNGIILDIENNKEYDWLMTRNKAIFALGDNESKPEDYDEIFDLEGNVLMSSFIKSHAYFSEEVFSYIQPDLSNCKSFEEIKDTIEIFIENNKIKDDQWIIAKGYDNNNLKEKVHPQKDCLDSISKTNPIVITHKSGTAGVLNAAAIEYLNIDKLILTLAQG